MSHDAPRAADLGAKLVQFGVAVPLLVPPLAGKPPAGVFLHYGLVIVLLPAAVGFVAGTALAPTQRFVLSVGIGLHGYGLLVDLYPRFWWWDVLTHVVSAAFLAAGAYAVLLAATGDRSGVAEVGRASARVHVAALLVVLGGGVAWEVYEVVAPWQTIYPTTDTTADLVADGVGWAVMAFVHPFLLGKLPDELARRGVRFAPGRGGVPDSRAD